MEPYSPRSQYFGCLFWIPLPCRVEIKLETGRQEVPKRSPRAFKNDPKFIPNDTRAPLEDQSVPGGTPLDADGAPGLHFHAYFCIYLCIFMRFHTYLCIFSCIYVYFVQYLCIFMRICIDLRMFMHIYAYLQTCL